MCGLVGLISKKGYGFTKKQQEVFASLLYIDYLRGPDSTGVFLIENNGEVMIAKEASTPCNFMDSKAFEKIMETAFRRGAAIIGHNRKATRGDVTDENAHPFVVDDNIVLVHNGTMYGDHKKHANVEVDSHAIAHILHEKRDDPTEALSSFDAAFALIWYDFQSQQLNLIRNKERPLWFLETDDEWVWASEPCMLNFVRQRYGLIVRNGPMELTPHNLQKFNLRNGSWDATFTALDVKKPWDKFRRTQGEEAWLDHFQNQASRVIDPLAGGDEYDDVPFNETLHTQLHPLQRENENRMLVETLGRTTSDYERQLAYKNNVIIPRGQFYNLIVNDYPQSMEIHGEAFDYTYANQHDEKGGWHLYLKAHQDPDVFCRLWLDSKSFTEERLIQIAGSGYIYKMAINRKWWHTLGQHPKDKELGDATPGYCILQCEKPILVYGGGVGKDDWAAQLNKSVVKH
jgi:hypothetical protein